MDKQYSPSLRKVCHSGEVIFEEGQSGDFACLIESGSVEVTIQRDNELVHLASLGEGDIFGEMALIDSVLRSATVTAQEETHLIIIRRDQFTFKMDKSDPLIRLFMQTILDRFRKAEYRYLFASSEGPTYQWQVEENSLEYRRREVIRLLHEEHRLYDALESREFELYYQPIFDLSKKAIVGFEALIRWNHPERGIVSPGEFIDYAEKTGAIISIGEWVLDEACRFLNRINNLVDSSDESEQLFVGVNLSSQQLKDSGIANSVAKVLSDESVPPASLKLEVTEGLLIEDPALAQDIISQFKELGVRIAIDDFGTGYSSLSYLHQFPFDTLKIDKSFVSQMMESDRQLAIIKGICFLAHNLDLEIIAEGVETQEELAMLKGLGCDFVQGYYISPPVPQEEALKMLSSGDNAD